MSPCPAAVASNKETRGLLEWGLKRSDGSHSRSSQDASTPGMPLERPASFPLFLRAAACDMIVVK